MCGYFGIGIYAVKTAANIGALWRSAYQLGAAFIFTIGKRYPRQASDTVKAWRHVPLFEYANFDDFNEHRPNDCPLIGIEMGGREIGNYCHPERSVYLLGAEDNGLPKSAIEKCQSILSIPSERIEPYNVAVAGSIIMFDRFMQRRKDRDGTRCKVSDNNLSKIFGAIPDVPEFERSDSYTAIREQVIKECREAAAAILRPSDIIY